MILASIHDPQHSNAQDGALVVAHPNRQVVALPTSENRSLSGESLAGVSLRQAIERWDDYAPALATIDAALRAGSWNNPLPLSSITFLAPLPRAWAFLDGSAFIQHVLLVRKARGAEPPEDLLSIPLMYQGASDNLLSATADIPLLDPSHGMDFESEVGIITDFVPMGTKAKDALKHVKLITILNDVSLRELIPREVGTGFGFLQSKPPSAFAPFVITPNELGDAWREGRVHAALETRLNGILFGAPNAGEMHFSFADLIEHAARTRPLSAGTIIGSGTVSNKDLAVGSSCLVEKRMIEKIETGSSKTPYLSAGDRVQITMKLAGVDIFGVIDQKVKRVAA